MIFLKLEGANIQKVMRNMQWGIMTKVQGGTITRYREIFRVVLLLVHKDSLSKEKKKDSMYMF